MSGIDRDLTPDPRASLIARHLLNTEQVQRLLQREGRGYIIRTDGSQTPLYYGEIKIVKATGKYHAIPRTRPRRTS